MKEDILDRIIIIGILDGVVLLAFIIMISVVLGWINSI